MNSTSTSKKPDRPRDPVWDDVAIDEDGIVYCLKCASRIHTLGFTHVERVKAHFNFKCSKRAHQSVVTSYFPSTLPAVTQRQFDKKFALWVYTTGMPFYKTSHMSCLEAAQVLNPAAKIPSQQALRGPLLAECYQDSIDRVRTTLARQASTLVTDAWTDVNGLSVINYAD